MHLVFCQSLLPLLLALPEEMFSSHAERLLFILQVPRLFDLFGRNGSSSKSHVIMDSFLKDLMYLLRFVVLFTAVVNCKSSS